MKKLLALLLVGVMGIVFFAGCGQSGAGLITEKQAREAAQVEVPDAKDENITACVLNENDKKYDVTIMYDGIEAQVMIDAVDGTVLRSESESVTAGNSPADGEKPADMGKEAIKKIALGTVEGAVDADITTCIISSDKKEYMVTLHHDDKVYYRRIDARTGEILDSDEKQEQQK